MLPIYEQGEVMDSEAHKLNRTLHPLMIALFDETHATLVAYRVGREDFRTEVLTRFDEIRTDLYRAMNSLGIENQRAKEALDGLAGKYPGLFHGQAGLYRDIKKKHGVE